MPLCHFQKKFKIKADDLEASDLLTVAKRKIGVRLYNMAVRVFAEFIESRDKDVSGGYFKFAMIIGESGQASKKDVDYLWSRMVEIYGDKKENVDFIKRILGTILMLCVARDSRSWAFKDDPDKKLKIFNEEIPEATEYFLLK